ncbi:MAG: sugar phosphate isomerase/epimerase, partial [Bryobacterales bacterium]|nr:sugar phosphate isomerase/epimerase [Bryobacterales bacterium]
MVWSRRAFLACGALAAALPALPRPAGLKLGVMDGVLGLPTKPEAFTKAKELGFEGVQVTIGRARSGAPLPLSDPSLQDELLAASADSGIPIVSTYLDVLHDECLASTPSASDRVLEGIRITSTLKAKILMTVFFDKCELKTHGATENAVEAFRYLAPAAADEGVVLGFESLLTAKQNLYVLEKVNSSALK